MTDSTLDALAARYLGKEPDTLDAEERRVLHQIEQQRPVSRDAAALADQQASFADRLADRVAAVGGSWGFIIGFAVVLFGWMVLNSDILGRWGMAFDPYPYIFLNLMLSTLAAIQAPVIMMSQNRQADKDRVAASLDFEINLRAEIEILRLHNKIDTTLLARLDQLAAQQQAILERLDTGR